MKQRVISAAVLIALMLGLLLWCKESRLTFFLACTVLSCWEMKRALEKLDYHVMIGYVYAACLECSVLIYFGKVGYAFPVFMVLLVAAFSQMILGHKYQVKDVFATLAVCAYPMSPLLIVVFAVSDDKIWAALLLNSLMPCIVSDTFALFGGKLFGKHKLAPHISPKKTVEGLICGLLMGTASGLLAHVILKALGQCVVPLWAEIIGALLASAAGAMGDLAASSVKRTAGIKDYSNLIPGHGGMMDRADSALFAIPVVYMLYSLFV